MRKHARLAVGIVLASFSVGALGACNTEAKSCVMVGGDFAPLYTPLDGTCGQITDLFTVPFDGGGHGVNSIMRTMGGAAVTTDIIVKGCTIHMTQTIQAGGLGGPVQAKIDGESIRIENEDRLAGRVFVTKYDQVGTAICNGNYDASFTKNTMTVGGAVGGAVSHLGVAGAGD